MQTALDAATMVNRWDSALYAFLAEKERRSGSRRTVESYSRMLQHCFATVGTTPDQLTPPQVFAWAHGVGLSGREPSSTTVGARLACLSSFYRFLIRMSLVSGNPCDALERPRTQPAQPRGLTAEEIKRLLAVVPGTPSGLRDRAIVLTLVLTGRRRAEVMALTAGDLQPEGETMYYRYRGKGGKSGKRELPGTAYAAIVTALAAWGKQPTTMEPGDSLWPAGDGSRDVTSGTVYGNVRRYMKAAGLPAAGLHVFRHSAAKLRRDAGESIETVSRFLDHSSLAVTSVYLRRLEGEGDPGWHKVAAALGV